MTAQSFSRSQAILRLPVDRLAATMLLHDGARSDVELFLPLGDTLRDLLAHTEPFLPVVRRERFCLVARAAIAALTVAEEGDEHDPSLPLVRQVVQVHLRSGVVLDGELRWVAPQGRQRTADHLNDGALGFQLFARGVVHHVFKAHVALVEEAP